MSNEIENVVGVQLCAVPEYTAEDYYSTSEPFEFLYAFCDNKFLLSQMRERMKQQAASVGVRSFMGLWNAFLEMKNSKKGVILDNATMFDGQESELYSGQYNCDDYGVTFIDRFGYEQYVCRHPIMPVRRLVNIDTGDEMLEIAFKKGRVWKSTLVPKTTLASSSSILELASKGVMVNSENAKLLSTYLFEMEQMNYDTIPEQKSVGRLGWVGEHGFSPFVEGLTFDGESSFRGLFNAVKPCGSYDVWLDAVRKMRAEKTIGRLFLAASFASVLIEPCGLLPFFLHSHGGTGNGKTVALKIAASVWGNPQIGEYITTFNSTDVGQEMTASFLNSLPVCVDELQIQVSAGVTDFDKMIYQLCEGVGKTRGAKSGGLQKQSRWRCCFITTGERPISSANSMGGAMNRVIEFECFEKVYSDLVGISNIVAENYGFAGQKFIEFACQPGFLDFVSDLQRQFYRELLTYDSTEKQAASASALLTADAIATELIFKDGCALTVEEVATLMSTAKEVDSNERAYEYIIELCAGNPNKFKANDFGSYQGEVWGKYEGDYVYIIKNIFNREIASAGYNAATFLSWAKRKNLLICDDGKRTKKSRIAGEPVNCVCLRKPDEVQPSVQFDEKVLDNL